MGLAVIEIAATPNQIVFPHTPIIKFHTKLFCPHQRSH